VHIGLEQCVVLIRVGAFRFFGKNKKELLWKAQLHFMQNKSLTSDTLFGVERKQFEFPVFQHDALEDAYDEMELMGFPLCSPFELIVKEDNSFIFSKELPNQLGKEVSGCVYYITCKPTRTSKGERMYFGNFLDVEGGFVDTAHFPQPHLRNMDWRGAGIYYIKGKVIEEFGAWSIEVYEMRKLAYQDDPRYSDLRISEKSRLRK
jgi:DNA polymerase-3 subunit alpha